MPEDQSKLVSTLNGLIEMCKDGQAGYHTAAEHVRNPTLTELFQSYSTQRERFVGELQAEVRRHGGDPEDHGSVVGALLRGWTDLKALVTGGDEHAIVVECQRSEDMAVGTYEAALKEDLPEDVRSLIERQLNAVKEAGQRLHALQAVTAKLA